MWNIFKYLRRFCLKVKKIKFDPRKYCNILLWKYIFYEPISNCHISRIFQEIIVLNCLKTLVITILAHVNLIITLVIKILITCPILHGTKTIWNFTWDQKSIIFNMGWIFWFHVAFLSQVIHGNGWNSFHSMNSTYNQIFSWITWCQDFSLM
jgi:hypothetical protein